MRAWFGPGSTEIESGYGDLSFKGEPRAAIAAYRGRLEAQGWTVEGNMLRAALPEIPPRQLESCVLRATRAGADTRIIMTSFELTPEPGYGSVYWAMAPLPTWSKPKDGPC